MDRLLELQNHAQHRRHLDNNESVVLQVYDLTSRHVKSVRFPTDIYSPIR